jgi:large subunit ribosomal protein L3
MIGLIGKKIGMTQIFGKDGKMIPVTVVEAGPCKVIHRKTKEKHGYDSIQMGFEEVEEKKVKKPQQGHFKKHGTPCYRHLKEFRLKFYKDIEEGEVLDVGMFVENEILKVTGTSKGRGFQGVMKRHGFHGFKASHGVHESYRGPGSIGMCATPARVHKGKKLPGHMGVDQVSVINLKVVKIDAEKNLVMISGAIPGHRNSIVYLRKEL